MTKETKKVKSFRTDKDTEKYIRRSWRFLKEEKGNEAYTIRTLIKKGYEAVSSSKLNASQFKKFQQQQILKRI